MFQIVHGLFVNAGKNSSFQNAHNFSSQSCDALYNNVAAFNFIY